MPKSQKVVGRTEIATNISDQFVALMTLRQSCCTFFSGDVRSDLRPRLDHVHWHQVVYLDPTVSAHNGARRLIVYGNISQTG
jgi:hypothetical protein